MVLTYIHLESRRIDKVTVNKIFSSMLHNTNRFHVAVCLYSYRSQKTLNCGKKISGNLYHLTTFEVICNLLRNKPTATWNLFVNEKKSVHQPMVLWPLETPYHLALRCLPENRRNKRHSFIHGTFFLLPPVFPIKKVSEYHLLTGGPRSPNAPFVP